MSGVWGVGFGEAHRPMTCAPPSPAPRRIGDRQQGGVRADTAAAASRDVMSALAPWSAHLDRVRACDCSDVKAFFLAFKHTLDQECARQKLVSAREGRVARAWQPKKNGSPKNWTFSSLSLFIAKPSQFTTRRQSINSGWMV